MSRSYFWRVKLFDGTTEEIDADYALIPPNGVLEFFNNAEYPLPGTEVVYAAGTWEKVLKVTIKEVTDENI